MLHVLLRIAGDAFAIDAACIERLVPFARLRALPSDLPALAGMLNFHGAAVPAIDLTLLLTGRPSQARLGTRILVARVPLAEGPRRLALVAEGATTVARIAASEFRPAGVRPDGRDWLGPVADHAGELVQRLEVGELLPPPLLAALERDAAAQLAP